MGAKNKGLRLSLLACTAFFLHFISLNAQWVETNYSNGIYPYISNILKHIFGWLPFSMGDIVYGALIIAGIVKVAAALKKIIRREYGVSDFTNTLYKIAVVLLGIYISFNFLWGLNYSREGIAYQLGIKKEKYQPADLVVIDSLLVDKVNEAKLSLVQQSRNYYTTGETVNAAVGAYSNISRQYPWLHYQPPSAKTSLWGWAGNYLGFIGYYNPFTGEAQLNTTVPKFIQPFTACHEIAHQLGYAKENEANFVGYLAASSSKDALLRYSAYLEMYMYAQGNLYLADSARAKYFSKKLLPQVKADLKELKDFNNAHQSPFEPISRWLYKKYLENNQQPAGLLSYEEVIGLLIAWHKKTGRI